MILLLAAAWFSAVQYAPRAASLRGCAECRGEPDDVCEVRAGALSLPLDEYARGRWAAPGRLRLLRPSAETGCAVAAKKLPGAIELAAVRMAAAPPSQALLDSVRLRAGIRGWPSRPQRRTADVAIAAAPDRAALRLAAVCWPSEHGWPSQAGADARPLGPSNACELWLLAAKPSGEPDLAGVSFALAEPSFPAGAQRWAAAFDRDAPLDESLFVAAPPPPPPAALAAAPAPAQPRRCADAARERTATLDRFDQWDLQIRRAAQPSLDRATLTLRSSAWSGHCQELEVLRAALERQLDCALAAEGKCE